MQLKFPEFFDYFIITQHFRRFSGAGFNNPHPFWFYVPVLAGLSLPWFVWLLLPRRRVLPPPPPRNAQEAEVQALMLIWLIVIVLFFSLPRSKLIGYVLPALPPLAALIAQRLLGSGRAEPGAWAPRITAALAALLCVGAILLIIAKAPPETDGLQRPADFAAVAAATQHAGAPSVPLVMLDRFDFELPFNWNLTQPVRLAGDWSTPLESERDNWRKELRDAATFAPQRGTALLVDHHKLAPVLCVPQPTWVLGAPLSPLLYPWLNAATVESRNDSAVLWRFPGSSARDPNCLREKSAAPHG